MKLENYYTHYSCAPSRGALMTGRYAFKLGMHIANDGSELPLYEVTLAQELKTAGYVNYMVGKWHIGFSTDYHLPTQRGFDHFFGYYNGFIDYWTKEFKVRRASILIFSSNLAMPAITYCIPICLSVCLSLRYL